jgi:chorismate mutase
VEQPAPRPFLFSGETTMTCRGIRGAITEETDAAKEILAATRTHLEQIVAANNLDIEDVASVIFTTTPDLTAV